MSTSSLKTSVFMIVNLCFVYVLVFATSCGSAGKTDAGVIPVLSDAIAPEAWVTDSGIPAPSELKSTQGVLSDVYHTGSDYVASWPHRRIWSTDESTAEYRPLTFLDPFYMVEVVEPAYAIYRFDATGFLHANMITVDWSAPGGDGVSWVGFANFELDTWCWQAIGETGIAHFDDTTCLDEGIAYVIVVLTGNTRWRLKKLYLGIAQPPHISSVSPLSGIEGELVEITPGLNIPASDVTTWNWDFDGAGSIGTSSEAAPSMTLGAPGVYECSVHASNTWGETDHTFFLTVDAADADWRHAAVGSTENQHMPTSLALALDSPTHPHVAYFESEWPSGSDLKHTYMDGGFWRTETVAMSASSMTNSSLATDSTGTPHLAYTMIEMPAYDEHFLLMHALAPDGVWEHHIRASYIRPYDLYTDKTEFRHPSLTIDDADQASICFWRGDYYEDIDDYELGSEYYCHVGPTPAEVVIPSDSYTLSGHASDINAAGRPCLAHIKNYELRYAEKSGTGDWIDTFVQSVSTVRDVALQVSDTDDRPKISYVVYQDPDGYVIRFAYFDGSDWQVSTLNGTGDVGRYISMALDSNSQPHICYYEETEADLCYATFEDVSWIFSTVDSNGDVGRYCDIALDSSDNAHFTYYDADNGLVKYAWAPE